VRPLRFALAASAAATLAIAGEPEQKPEVSSPYALVKGPDGTVKAPLFSEKYASLPIARVEGELVTLRDLTDALASTHEARKAEQAGAHKDFHAVLDRLIGAKLVVLEAREMGLEELPEVKSALGKDEETTLRETLKARVIQGAKPDPAEVDSLYKELVREWKVKSVQFAKEADAIAMAAALKAGKPFDALAAEALAAKKTTGSEEGFASAQAMLPQVRAAVRTLKVGEASAVIRVPTGWALLTVKEMRYPPNDAAAKAQAQQESLKRRQLAVLTKFYEGLVAKYAKVDEKLLHPLDFEAKKPGFEALAKDTRVLVRIDGEKPITVADLAGALRDAHFHGVEEAIKEKKLNKEKYQALDAMLSRILVGAEARRQGIARTPEYQRAIADYRQSILFGAFVQRVILPEVTLAPEEVQQAYEDHKSEYQYPAFYTLQSLGFSSPKSAQKAFDKLKAGTDFKWLKANADGQLPEDKRSIDFDGKTLTETGMTAELAKALAGVKKGDLRLHAAPEGQYVIQVVGVTPSEVRPFDEVRGEVADKLKREKLNRTLEDWISRLRRARDVKVYITGIGT